MSSMDFTGFSISPDSNTVRSSTCALCGITHAANTCQSCTKNKQTQNTDYGFAEPIIGFISQEEQQLSSPVFAELNTAYNAWKVPTPEPTTFNVTAYFNDFPNGIYQRVQKQFTATLNVPQNITLPSGTVRTVIVKDAQIGTDSSGFYPLIGFLLYDRYGGADNQVSVSDFTISPASWVNYPTVRPGVPDTPTTTVTVTNSNIDKTALLNAFKASGYYSQLSADQQTALNADPVAWLNSHPYLFTTYPSYFSQFQTTYANTSTAQSATVAAASSASTSTNTTNNNSMSYTNSQIDSMFAGVAYTDIDQWNHIHNLEKQESSDIVALSKSISDIDAALSALQQKQQTDYDQFNIFKKDAVQRVVAIEGRLNDPKLGLDAINKGLMSAYNDVHTLSDRIEGAYKDIADLGGATNTAVDQLHQVQHNQNSQGGIGGILQGIIGGLATGGALGGLGIIVIIALLFFVARRK